MMYFSPQDVYVIKENQLKKKKRVPEFPWIETLHVYIAQITFILTLKQSFEGMSFWHKKQFYR